MTLAISSLSALYFLPLAIPVSIWAAWNDMKFMKIPNIAVLILAAGFLAISFFALPLAEIPWRLLNLAVVLAIGFIISSLGLVGAGDAKFAAAMAPFVAYGDFITMLYLFAAVMVAAYITHRIFQNIPAFRRMTPEWKSWENKDFPMGLALGSALVLYLVLGYLYGVRAS
jgi:prepilin peptidase CpaA